MDHIDRRLIDLLLVEGRASYADLGRRLDSPRQPSPSASPSWKTPGSSPAMAPVSIAAPWAMAPNA